MTIALDANLGTNNVDGSGTTVTLTTANEVASGGFIVVGITMFDPAETLSGVSGGGLDWSIDKQARPPIGGPQSDHVAIASAQAPSGLVASTVITATFSAAVIAKIIGGTSFTGVATSSPVDGTPTGPTYTDNGSPAAGWSTANYAIAAGSLIYATCFTENSASGSTPTDPALEAWERVNGGGPYGSAANYRIESSAGSYTVAGTWGASCLHNNVAVAYLAAEDEPAGDPADRRMIRTSRATSW